MIAQTTTRALALIGAGALLAAGHAFVRVSWMGRPPIQLTRTASVVAPTEPTDDPASTTPTESGNAEESGPTTEPVSDRDRLLDTPVKAGSITLREASELFDEGAYFLDARSREDFDLGYIEAAFWMPASHARSSAAEADLLTIPPDATIVIYCTGGDCDASENTAIALEQMQYGFTDIRILGMGYTDWLEAGLPVEGVAP